MATIRAYGSFVLFIWTLVGHGHVSISEDLLSLRLNLHIGAIYVKQKMYYMDGNISNNLVA